MVNSKNIPQYLKENASFCNWRYENRDGNLTKVPYNPKTGSRASVNDNNTFTDFETVIEKVNNYDGIGIKVDGRIIAIDLDHCIENNNLCSWALNIGSHFNNTYIETSPSGTGLRIILLAPDDYKYDKENYYIKKGNVEVYVAGCTNRFVTITGNAIQKVDIAENISGFQWLIDTYMKRPRSNSTQITNEYRISYLSDDSVIQKAMASRQGEKFNKLWNGDISDYPSHSESDLALTSILTFYCNGDKEQIDRLYRKSSLFRNKWDELRGNKTYGEMTIDTALNGSKEFYSPTIKTNPTEDFNDDLEQLSNLNPVDVAKYPWTDIGAGMLFADFYQEKLRYVPERKSWFYYENGIWTQDIGGLKAMRFCMTLANLLHMYALKIEDEHKRKIYMDYSKKWQSHNYRVNILKDALDKLFYNLES